MTVANMELELPTTPHHLGGLPVEHRRAMRQNRGDRVFFGGLTLIALVAPAMILLFIVVLLDGAWPSIREFGLSFITSSVWEPNPDKEQYGALPLIVSVALDAVRAVPSTYREAALGLGATRWEMIRMAVWPPARSGFIGACILALGRALGETMAVTMVIGNGRRIAMSLLAASDTVASTIANQFAEAPSDLFAAALIEMALLLFLVTLTLNIVARVIVRKHVASGGAS